MCVCVCLFSGESWLGPAKQYTIRHCIFPLDLTSGSGFATDIVYIYLNSAKYPHFMYISKGIAWTVQ